MTSPAPHIPVLLAEVVNALAPKEGGIYVDGTFGRGGYTRALLESAKVQVIGIDRDPTAIDAAQDMIRTYAPRLSVLHGTFGAMAELLAAEGITQVDGIALDIGVSSPQLDEAERGFSFQEDGPLDMRMSCEGESAADIVNTASEKDLADIIFHFGEERFARRVARAIVARRKEKPLTRTTELAAVIRSVVPRSGDGVDPATRSFQALRIAVNDELGELKRGLQAAEKLLRPGGTLAVVSFHSLEDRCVKEFLRKRSESAPRVSRHAPSNDKPVKPSFCLQTRKPCVPSETETEANPRSRSARLRIATRTDASPLMEKAA